MSWASHLAATGTVALTVDYVHLLAAQLWAGGLLWVAILAWVLRPIAAPVRDACDVSSGLGTPGGVSLIVE